MFLALLNDDEKSAFVGLADHLITADDMVLGEEKQALAALKREMGLAGTVAGDEQPVDELAAIFSSRRSRIAALLELLGLAYSDADFALNEESMIVVAAQEMGIDEAELALLEDWVKEHIDLVERALVMMQG